MSDIGQDFEKKDVVFVWSPPEKDVPELEFYDMTIEELENEDIK